jgi:hypothetical protein
LSRVIARRIPDDVGDQRGSSLDSSGHRRPKRRTPRCFSSHESSNPSAAMTRGDLMVTPIHIPEDWDDNALILFDEFCELIRTPQRTVRDWRQRGVGPRWTRFQGVGRLYITVAEARRFLASATVTRVEVRSDG